MERHLLRTYGVLVAGLLSLGAVPACGSSPATDAARPTASPSASPSAIASPTEAAGGIAEPAPVEEWTRTTDAATGVSFALPGTAKLSNRAGNAAGTTPTLRMYGFEVEGGVALSVGFTEAAAADYSAEGLDIVVDTLLENFTEAGVDDAIATHRRHTTVDGHPTLDYGVSFTANNGDRSVWFGRIIGDGTRAVHVQSIAFADPAEVQLVEPVVEEYHGLVVGTVRMP